jgi:hypothetical protein
MSVESIRVVWQRGRHDNEAGREHSGDASKSIILKNGICPAFLNTLIVTERHRLHAERWQNGFAMSCQERRFDLRTSRGKWAYPRSGQHQVKSWPSILQRLTAGLVVATATSSDPRSVCATAERCEQTAQVLCSFDAKRVK